MTYSPDQPPPGNYPAAPGQGYGTAQVPMQPRNGLGTAALVLGIIGVIFAFIPFLCWIGTILGGLAVIFGLIGHSRKRKGQATNGGAAIAGWVLGAIALVLSVIFMVMAALAVNQAVNDLQTELNGLDSQQTQTGSGSEEGQTQPQAGIGTPVKDGNLTFTVTGAQTTRSLGEGMMATEANGKYVVVNLKVKNTGDQAATFNAGSSQVAYDKQGNEYSTSQDPMMSGNAQDMNSFLQQINPGQTVEGRLVYEVPKKVTLTRVHLQGGMMTSGVTVSLK